ncbi:MAG: type IV secretory system conjugative DNA transfer family protein [Patescibacteria group bacterium]
MSESTLLEVRVDRLNEKGVFVAEQILNILHNTVDEHTHGFFHKHQTHFVPYGFEIANIAGVIRFFFRAPRTHVNILRNQIYAHFPNVELTEVGEYLPNHSPFISELALAKEYLRPIKIYTEFKDRSEKETVDPLSSLTSALSKANKNEPVVFQVNFSPILDSEWKDEHVIEILASKRAKWIKKILLSPYGILFKMVTIPLITLGKLALLVIRGNSHDEGHDDHHGGGHEKDDSKKLELEEKIKGFGYAVDIRIASYTSNEVMARSSLKEIATSLNIFARPNGNSLKASPPKLDAHEALRNRTNRHGMYLNTAELAGIVHMPTIYVKTPGINWVVTKKFEPPHNIPTIDQHDDATPLGVTNFRGSEVPFGILPNDRRRHVYVIGKTGMGKSTLLENMIYDDIQKGRGVGLVDPHGDLAETILACIPKNRTNDVIVFDPSDYRHPIAFNMLEQVKPELRPIVASGLVSIFKKIFGDSWGPRLEHIMRNTVMTLLEMPDTTIMSIPLMLTMKSYRLKLVAKIKDPSLARFWTSEYEVLEPRQMTEAAAPILNKVGQFLSSPLMRNILGQPKNPFSLRWAMDNGKIIIIKLPKGTIGEDSSALLGAMMVTKFQIDAMSRADIPEHERRDFYLYVDEFQNFATDSFATILSEARKYKLNLVMANQYIEQMTETVQGAVFGNVGTLVSFQVGFHDATKLSEVLDEEMVLPNDLMNLRKYDIYTKLLIDGMPSPVFSATTLGPIRSRLTVPEQQADVVIKVSREKYSKPVDLVERKILEFNMKVVDDEKKFQKAAEEFKEKKKEEKRLRAEAEKAKPVVNPS